MDNKHTQQLASIHSLIDEVIEQTIAPSADQTDRESVFPKANMRALAAKGLNGILLPQDLGGLAAGYEAFSVIVEKIASHCPSTGLVYTMHVEAADAIYRFGTEEQYEKWLIPVQDGWFGTTSTSERASGGRYWINTSKAKRTQDGYELNLEKSFTTSSGYADFYIIQTGTPDNVSADDLSYFIIEGSDPGLSWGSWDALGVKGNHSSSLTLSSVQVPKENLLGAEGAGRSIVEGSIAYLLGLGSVWTGLAGGIVEEITTYCKRNHHRDIGKSLGDYQVIRALLAKAVIRHKSLTAWLNQLRIEIDQQLDRGLDKLHPATQQDLLSFKIHASEMVNEIAQIAMDITGGYGYKIGKLERFYRDARAGIVMGPSNNLARDILAKQIVGISDDLWEETS
ncbi:acyl-CoA dehydrogenase family protein [Terribacillus sp. 179-K 1B1 HS]|uniref:acyl-CoA dehydrogenase family protein n=1 Tax=Terribacillus sp. 179-K 1B1 HS TaxID=3142388 RepID=UPI00399F3512